MNRVWKIVGVATLVAILGVAAIGAVAYAQEDEGSGFPFNFGERFREALAGILGVTVEEYDAAVEQAQGQVVDEALAEGWLTEEQAQMFKWRMEQGPDFGMRGMGKGFRGFDRGMLGPRDNLHSVAADELGMSLTELLTELQAGKSIADVAGEKSVDVQAIADAYLAELRADLDEAVADGKITQNQADWMLEQAQERVPEQLNNTWEGRFPGGFPGGGRPGRMGGFPGQSEGSGSDA
jgi:polyhydroxyalkanoate synthesis regulator phasin